ncbi:MAG: toxin-antitoxin system HicB family antitoxin [Rhizobiales bacterium]|nr:toxin-antitoxin system HicB family antitoxin [Hyphomicrobiales bacterium]
MTVKHMIRFPDDLYAKIKVIAERDERSINYEVAALIRLAIADYERRNGPIAVTPPDNAPTPG